MKRKDTGLDAGAVTLLQLFKGEREYISPLFQRQYVWGAAEINSLWEGLDQILEGEDSERFLGALVLEVKSAGMAFQPDSAWIVDGQQRLTTLYLTLVIIAKLAIENGAQNFASDLLEQYIFNQGGKFKNAPKIRPTLVDFKQFNDIFLSIDGITPKLSASFGSETGNLSVAVKRIEAQVRARCIKDKVFSEEATMNVVAAILEKLAFVQIVLGDEHNAHQVFDSLNSKGIRLENKDLIRNLVFQKLASNPEQAQTLYTNKWVPLEEQLGERFDGYFFPFVLVERPTATKSNLLAALREKWKNKAAFEIIEDLKTYVDSYNALSAKDVGFAQKLTDSSEINSCLVNLNRMRMPSSVYPFIFRLLSAYDTGSFPEKSVVDNLKLIESFLVRRAFAGFEPTGLHAVFKDLWAATQGDPSALIANIDAKVTVQFPSDATFRADIQSRPLYGRKLAPYIVLEYERSLRGGDPLPEVTNLSLDHIIPKDITPDWSGSISKSDFDELVHVWGNLVPLSINANSEKGRKNWTECRNFFRTETIYKTTKRLAEENETWDAESIRKRGDALAVWALERWPKEALK
jgi:uncharacterized protein with ParB-like and HNH nuclease domain